MAIQPGEAHGAPSMDAIDVSVVIPAYYGAKTIAACLESVERATHGRRHEIIVVDSSGDDTGTIVRTRFPNVIFIQSAERLSAGGARNLGSSLARGRFVFFTDQDCVVPPDWIDRLGQYFDDPTIAGVGGTVGIQNPSSLSGCAMYFLEFLTHFPRRGTPKPKKSGQFLIGCNNGYRRAVLDRVQFPNRTLAEDVLFSDRLRRQGFVLLFDPTSEVRHRNREGWREFFTYNRKMGRAAAAYYESLRLWWMKPFLRAPTFVFIAPMLVMPRIGFRLARSRWSYFLRFLLVLPMCVLGNLSWAAGFRRQVLDGRQQAVGDCSWPPA